MIGRKKRVLMVVPVSPSEPDYVIINSAECLKGIDLNDADSKVVYIIDLNNIYDLKKVRKVECALKDLGFEIIRRKSRCGRKAGAINIVLDTFKSFDPDYVVIFDVDTRPAKNFVVECIKALESDDDAYIASAPRYVNNVNNTITEVISMEYKMFNYLMSKFSFKNFNGPIGVIRADRMVRLNENSIAEDLDFSIRMYLKGYKSIFVKNSYIYEQAPMTWKDLLYQRRRWYYGGLQVLKDGMIFRNKKFASKIVAITVLSHLPIFLLPFLILLSPIILCKFKKLKLLFGFVTYLIVNQLAAISSLCSFLMRREIEWRGVRRAKL